MSIGKHRRGRPGKAGVDYQGHTGRRVQRRGAPLEDAFHVLFDCARHADTARADLLRASARWCTRANVPHDCDGRRAALHWAMTDQPPPSSPLIALQSPTACAELRQCIQHCYALSLSRRYNKAKGAASQPLSNK